MPIHSISARLNLLFEWCNWIRLVQDRYKQIPAEFGPMVTRLVHFLYNEMDVLQEDAILEWVESIDDVSSFPFLIVFILFFQ